VQPVDSTYRGRGVPFADLIQEDTIGSVQAVKRFDHRREVEFSASAAWWDPSLVARRNRRKIATSVARLASSGQDVGCVRRSMRIETDTNNRPTNAPAGGTQHDGERVPSRQAGSPTSLR
jgi:sigma-70-like protein